MKMKNSTFAFLAAVTLLIGNGEPAHADATSAELLDRLLTSTDQDIRDAEARIAHHREVERWLNSIMSAEEQAQLIGDLRAQREEVIHSFARAVGNRLSWVRTEVNQSVGIEFDAQPLVASYLESRITRATYSTRLNAFKFQNWLGQTDDRMAQHARIQVLGVAQPIAELSAFAVEASGALFLIPGGVIPGAGIAAVGVTTYALAASTAHVERRKVYLGLHKLILTDQLRVQLYSAILRAAEAKL